MPTEQMERHLRANMTMSKKDIIISNFLGGLAWGLGTVVGATVVFAAIGAFLNFLGVFDVIGTFFVQVNNLNQQLPRLR